jgi:drug/metabolite transporter (DMT)-like permease
VFTALLAWFIFRENVDRRVALGMLAIVLGGGLLVWEGRLEWGGLLGPLAIAGACACWAIDNNLTQKVSASDPIQIAALKGGVAGTVNLAIGLVVTGSLPTLPRTVAALTLGFFGYGVSLVLFVLALRGLGTARTGAYFSTAPFVGAILSVALWREPLTPALLAGGLLMAIGVWLHLSERHVHEHTHERCHTVTGMFTTSTTTMSTALTTRPASPIRTPTSMSHLPTATHTTRTSTTGIHADYPYRSA